MKSTSIALKTVFMIAISFLLISCTEKTETLSTLFQPSLQINITPSLTSTGGKNSTPIILNTPTDTPTAALVSSATQTPGVTNSATSNPTPLPTYSLDEAHDVILSYLKENGYCLFPCIWGFDPSITSINNIMTFFDRFPIGTIPGQIDINNCCGEISVLIGNNQEVYSTVNFAYIAQGLKIGRLSIFGEFHNKNHPYFNASAMDSLYGEFLISQILKTYGEPSDIYIKPDYDDPNAPRNTIPLFHLILFYKEKQFYIEYIFPKERIGNEIIGCPYKTGFFIVNTWPSSEKTSSLSDIITWATGPGINVNTIKSIKLLQDVTSLSVDDFVGTYVIKDSSVCINTVGVTFFP